MVAERSYFRKLAAEAELLRAEWGDEIKYAESSLINEARGLLENALLSIQELKQPWQLNILRLISIETNQDTFWRDFLEQCLYEEHLLNTAQLCWADENRFAKR